MLGRSSIQGLWNGRIKPYPHIDLPVLSSLHSRYNRKINKITTYHNKCCQKYSGQDFPKNSNSQGWQRRWCRNPNRKFSALHNPLQSCKLHGRLQNRIYLTLNLDWCWKVIIDRQSAWTTRGNMRDHKLHFNCFPIMRWNRKTHKISQRADHAVHFLNTLIMSEILFWAPWCLRTGINLT